MTFSNFPSGLLLGVAHSPKFNPDLDYLTALLIGMLSATGAVLPPGMLNMSVVTASLESGRRTGYWYAGGVVTVFFVQAAVAIIGVNYLRVNPDLVELLGWWAIPVLACLAVYFLFKWYRQRNSPHSVEEQREREENNHPFRQGISVSLVNFLAIPYFFAIGSWLMNDGILATAAVAKACFVVGAAAGAMLILAGYARSARWIDGHAHVISRHIHLLVGALFVVLAGVQSYRMFF